MHTVSPTWMFTLYSSSPTLMCTLYSSIANYLKRTFIKVLTSLTIFKTINVNMTCICSFYFIVYYIFLFPGLREYCQFESFEASCKRDEVVMMQIARYGRLRIGKCVQKDYGYLGCNKDVLHILDKLCSGRRRCEQEVVDPFFAANERVCNQEFKNHLEAQYSCIKGNMIY